MRRGKPQQQYYRPGSGPLRKSGHGIEDNESDTNIVLNSRQSVPKNIASNRLAKIKSEILDKETDIQTAAGRINDMRLDDSDMKRRSKKPEQPIYVPRAVQMARESNSESNRNFTHQSERNQSQNSNGNQSYNTEKTNTGRSKRYSHRRRPTDAPENRDEWRAASPANNQNRNFRQGSEPRSISHNQANGTNWNRQQRDTRSVEPAVNMPGKNYNEKIHQKPPSGRRHSTIGLEMDRRSKIPNFDSLPPRFKRKILEGSKMTLSCPTEESWDGSSITFEGTHGYGHQSQNYSQGYISLPGGHQPSNQHVQSNNKVYYTLPNNKPRGRGRFIQDHYDPNRQEYRSMTPDRNYSPNNSRPHTPTLAHKTRSNEALHKPHSRSQTPVNVRRANESQQEYERRFYGGREMYNERKVEFGGKIVNDVYSGPNSKTPVFRDTPRRPQLDIVPKEMTVQNEESSKLTSLRESLEAQLLPVSTATTAESEENKTSVFNVNNAILDWSEEVELNERLEQEAFSDALTRSSSVISLMETSTASLPATSKKPKKRKSGRKNKKRSDSRGRDRSTDNQHTNRNQSRNYQPEEDQKRDRNRIRQNSVCSVDSNKDNFKVPDAPRHRRRSKNRRDNSYDRRNRSKNASRESSFDRTRRSSTSEHENWREEMKPRELAEREFVRSRHNSEMEPSKDNDKKESNIRRGGLLVLPQNQPDHSKPPELNIDARYRYQEVDRKPTNHGQKSLFDPNNPNKPIIVKAPVTRSTVPVPGFSGPENPEPPQLYYTTDQFGNLRPGWYDEKSEGWKSCRFPGVLRDIKRADSELQFIINKGYLLINWGHVITLRTFLMDSLEYLLTNDLKFSQTENIEQHFWKILFHNIIEMTRKAITNDPKNKEQYKAFVLNLIDEGTNYFERLLDRLEVTYKFKLNSFLGNNSSPQSGLRYVGLALVSAQKIFLFLGDLGRYREQVNESSNYGKCRQWYIKANEINPKNGKPYNQLAVLAVYARRKLDAVYYYMRSLMSSNPVMSAKESLISLFDEIRKKYEQGQRKRREDRLERARQNMKEKESESTSQGSLRRETWIRPDGGRRVHRTTPAVPEQKKLDSEEEDLATLTSMEVNKRFVTSYLHVQGKLITKIGMETFQETSLQMLKEFRALLLHSPVPLPCNRLLQILALNMFAIESTQLKDPQLQSGYRSELQERALIVSLQMFNLILERCIALLQDHLHSTSPDVNTLPQDVPVFLPAIKIWCDWMLCHSSVWNPPPSTQDFKVGQAGDAWGRMAILMNLLEKLDISASSEFMGEPKEGYEQIRLPEDGVLSGFTPLMHNVQEPTYAPQNCDSEEMQFVLRMNKLLFFGTVFLCGLDPPVLKLELKDDAREYVSVVRASSSRSTPSTPPELNEDDDLLVESFSEDEEETPPSNNTLVENASSEVRELLTRKVELDKRLKNQELHRLRVQKILQQSVVSVHIEVRPKYLIPDTNCFIDYLETLKTVSAAHVYVLMVPLVVLNELEGLARGGKHPAPAPRTTLDPEHVRKVAESAKQALEFLGTRHQFVKCITTKGTILTSSTFTVEDDNTSDVLKNDDKILATCLTLCKSNKDQHVEGQPRELYREVVLLTEDRNLRVKALARDVPVRELPDFMIWAGLG